MNNDVLSRSMFKSKADNGKGGIMAILGEGPEQEEAPMIMDRSPQNPEILMNNLRGDMRSVDARYMELADMVGEEAAMETPPEVLAMLQEHFAMMQQPQAGIGGLPQGAGMMPPPMAMQGAPMPMDQGPMMPPGGEGMEGPFPQGGAEEAPPTPDGLPPVRAALGAFITPLTRAAQMAGPRIVQGAQAANAALGRLLTQPVSFANRYPLPRDPATGKIMKNLQPQYLTATEGIAQLARQYPKVADVLTSPMAWLTGLGVYGSGYGNEPGPVPDKSKYPAGNNPDEYYPPKMPQKAIGYEVPVMAPAAGAGQGRGFISPDYYEQDPNMRSPYPEIRSPKPVREGPLLRPEPQFRDLAQEAADKAVEEAAAPAPAEPTAAEMMAGLDVSGEGKPTDTTTFIERIKEEQKKPTSKIDRIKAGYEEYLPLFESLIDTSKDKQDMRTNAMLLLADAGFKLASSKQPTLAMAIGESFAGVPRGLAALASDAKERGVKLKTAALTQSINDITAADKYAAELQKEILKQRAKLLKDMGDAGEVRDYVGAGLMRVDKIGPNKQKSFERFELDPNDPTVTSAIDSEYTLKVSSPYVQDQGRAPTTMLTDKDARNKKVSGMADLENGIAVVDQMRNIVTKAYGPGSFFVDAYNNLLVPLGTPPAVQDQTAVDQLTQLANTLRNSIARAEQEGRLSNQDVEFVNATLARVLDPAKFFSDPQTAAATLTALRTNLLNARHTVGTQLGFFDRRRMLSAPATGTQNDPFVISSDPDQARAMYSFLAQTLGKNLSPTQGIYVKRNGAVESINAGSFAAFLPKEGAK